MEGCTHDDGCAEDDRSTLFRGGVMRLLTNAEHAQWEADGWYLVEGIRLSDVGSCWVTWGRGGSMETARWT